MKKIAIFAHDAGGSEILLELLKASLDICEFKVFCTLDSSCYALIIRKKLTSCSVIINPIKESIFHKLDLFNPDMVLYGTGWQNHFEYHFLDYARKNNLPSVVFLDNWTNFRERFGYPDVAWQKNFPDFIATHDKVSKNLAISLGLKNVITIKNYSLINLLDRYKKIDIKENDTLLFLSEPTAKVAKKTYGNPMYWGFDESSMFKTILKQKKKLTCKDILVRLHPADDATVYRSVNKNIKLSSSTLLEDIAQAKVVIGVDSSALYLAFLLGKKVIAFMPSSNRNFCVPLPKSNQTRNLENFDFNSIEINQNKNSVSGIDFALFVKNTLG